MKKLNWFQNWIAQRIHLTDFNYNAALKWTWDTAMQQGIDKGRKEKADCLSCPLYHSDQIRKMGLYEKPGPTTSGKIATAGQTQGIRQRAITRDLTNHPGTALHHQDHFKERVQHESIPTQHNLPRMRPPHKTAIVAMNDDWLLH